MKQHNKLVRDGVPPLCEANGATAHTRVLRDDAEYLGALGDKACEEADEVREALREDDPAVRRARAIGELADLLQVVRDTGTAIGCDLADIEAARAQKAEERGGFEGRIFLISTDE